MNISKARELGHQRGLEAVRNVKYIPRVFRKVTKCHCSLKRVCELCLSFAANTKEEMRRETSKAEWFAILDKFKSFRDPGRIRDVFEEGTFEGVRKGVNNRLMRQMAEKI